MANNVRCIACDAGDLHVGFNAVANNGEKVEIYVCLQCGSLTPIYTRSDKENPNNNTLEQQIEFHERYWENDKDEEILKESYELEQMVNKLEVSLTIEREYTILELGVGRGTMLAGFKRKGYRIIGCEASSKLANVAKRVFGFKEAELFVCTADKLLEKLASKNEKVGCVILWHVLEHLERPFQTLRRLKDVLIDDGLIVLQIPMVTRAYLYPEHMIFFTIFSIKKIAQDLNYSIELLEYDYSNLYLSFALRNRKEEDASKAGLNINYVDIISYIFSCFEGARDEYQKETDSQAEMINERDEVISAQKKLIDERYETIATMDRMIRDRDDEIAGQRKLIEERWDSICQMEKMIKERDITIEGLLKKHTNI